MWLEEMLTKKGIKKKMKNFDYCKEYLTSISNIIMVVLKKANFHSVDI